MFFWCRYLGRNKCLFSPWWNVKSSHFIKCKLGTHKKLQIWKNFLVLVAFKRTFRSNLWQKKVEKWDCQTYEINMIIGKNIHYFYTYTFKSVYFFHSKSNTHIQWYVKSKSLKKLKQHNNLARNYISASRGFSWFTNWRNAKFFKPKKILWM